jgi:hypothetical protein
MIAGGIKSDSGGKASFNRVETADWIDMIPKWLKWLQAWCPSNWNLDNKVLVYHKSVFAAVKDDRQPFLTANGYADLGPSSMKENNHIVILCDGSSPYTLRMRSHTERHGKKYAFESDCCVCGIMDGEAVPETNPITFVLI